MKNCTRHCEHVSHGDAHVDPTERLMDFEIMRTVLERSGIVTTDLVADTCRAFQVIFLYDEPQKRRCQIKTYQQLQEEGSGHRNDLRNDTIYKYVFIRFENNTKMTQKKIKKKKKTTFQIFY